MRRKTSPALSDETLEYWGTCTLSRCVDQIDPVTYRETETYARFNRTVSRPAHGYSEESINCDICGRHLRVRVASRKIILQRKLTRVLLGALCIAAFVALFASCIYDGFLPGDRIASMAFKGLFGFLIGVGGMVLIASGGDAIWLIKTDGISPLDLNHSLGNK